MFNRFSQFADRPDGGTVVEVESDDRVAALLLDFSHPLQQPEDLENPKQVLLMSREGIVDLAHEILATFETS